METAQMRHDRIVAIALAALMVAWHTPGAVAGDLILEALPVSAGAVEVCRR